MKLEVWEEWDRKGQRVEKLGQEGEQARQRKKGAWMSQSKEGHLGLKGRGMGLIGSAESERGMLGALAC